MCSPRWPPGVCPRSTARCSAATSSRRTSQAVAASSAHPEAVLQLLSSRLAFRNPYQQKHDAGILGWIPWQTAAWCRCRVCTERIRRYCTWIHGQSVVAWSRFRVLHISTAIPSVGASKASILPEERTSASVKLSSQHLAALQHATSTDLWEIFGQSKPVHCELERRVSSGGRSVVHSVDVSGTKPALRDLSASYETRTESFILGAVELN